jgi:hypothetical protein
MPQIMYAIIVVLNYPDKVAGLIAFAQMVVQKMIGNAYFPTTTPPLSAVTAAITAYQAAVSASATTKDLKGQRATTRNTLLMLLRQLRDNVRVVCEANPSIALEIAESAGMTLKGRRAPGKALIAVIQGAVTGSVVCRAKAPGIPTNYFWSYSVDQKTWVSAPQAMKATITVSGLTAGQTYCFRYYTTTRKGQSDLSQIVSLLVK